MCFVLSLLAIGLWPKHAHSQELTIVSPCPLPDAIAGSPYSHQLVAEGGIPPYRWSVVLDLGFPAGFSVNSSSGLLVGNTNRVGTYGFLITVADAGLGIVAKRCSLSVRPIGPGGARYTPSRTSISRTFAVINRQPGVESLTLGAVRASNGSAISIPFQISFSTSTGSWLRVSSNSATTPATLAIGMDATGLAEGSHEGRIVISSADGFAGTITIPVVAVVGHPALRISESAISLEHRHGTAGPEPYSLQLNTTIANSRVPFRATKGPECAWLSLNPFSGSAPAPIALVLDTSALRPGSYTCPLSFSSTEGPPSVVNVPVTLSIRAQAPSQVSPASLSFYAESGAPTTEVQLLTVASTSSDFRVEVFPAASWIVVTPTSGTTPERVSVTVATENLTEGTYQAVIRISGTGPIKDEHVVPVTLQVVRNAELFVSPRLLEFESGSGSIGRQERIVTLRTSSSPVGYEARPQESWMSATPSQGVAGTYDSNVGTYVISPVNVRLQADPSNLTPGVYRSVFDLRSRGSQDDPPLTSPSRVSVTLTVRERPSAVPLVISGGGWRTKVYLTNGESRPAPVVVRFFKAAGEPWSLPVNGGTADASFTGVVPAGGLLLLDTGELGDEPIHGWASIDSNVPVTINSVFRAIPTSGAPSLTSTSSIAAKSRSWWLPYDTSAQNATQLIFVNPNRSQSTDLQLIFRDSDGNVAGSQSIHLAGGAQRLLPVRLPAGAQSRGMVRVISSDADIHALSTASTPDSPLQIAAPLQASATGPNERVVGTILDRSDILTEFHLFNPSTTPVKASVLLRSAEGLFLPWGFEDFDGSSDLTGVVPPFGSITVRTAGTGAGGSTGWSQILTTGSLLGSTTFWKKQANTSVWSGSQAFLGAAGVGFLFPFDNTDEAVTTVTLTNPDPTTGATAGLTVRDEAGKIVQSLLIHVPAGSQKVVGIDSEVPDSANIRGTVEVRYHNLNGYASSEYRDAGGSRVYFAPITK